MKLFRHGAPGSERAGAVDAAGVKRDLSLLVPDITPDWLAPEKLAALAAIDLTKMPALAAGTRIGAPVGGVRQFVAIGLNYGKHAAETGAQPPKEPIVFNKAITSLQGPDDDVKLPEGSEQMDWEVELAVVIGKTARRVSREQALSYVAGYCLANDVSERHWQIHRGGQWVQGQELRHLRADRPLSGDGRRDPRSAEPAGVAEGQRRDAAEQQHQRHDLPGRRDRRPSQPVHDAAARRRDRHRHAGGRRPRHEAAASSSSAAT